MSASTKTRAKENDGLNWQLIHLKLKHPGTTLKVVWSDYQDKYSYEQFCRYYKQWRSTLNILVRGIHEAGAELSIAHLEFPNLSFRVLNSETGEVYPVSLIVAVLPASNYCFAEVWAERNIVTWLESHANALQFFGGSTRILVIDPEDYVFAKHSLFQERLKHSSTRIKLADTTKRPVPILLLRWLNKTLSQKTFLGVAEANVTILSLVDRFNARKFKKIHGSPSEWFSSFERENLIAGTPKSSGSPNGKKPAPENSGKTAFPWSPNRVRRWAKTIGPATSHLVAVILDHARNSQRGVCSCLGILSLEQEYGRERLESACRSAFEQANWTVSRIRKLLKGGLDQSFVQLTIPYLNVPASETKKTKND